ncbi:CHASE2 domain-containing protein [Zoogloea sp.]|uniref:CHASE2 domain-containing protein n=1 Tax=Zoogloea sp. TaxID=49181 RepID=UPI0035B211F3
MAALALSACLAIGLSSWSTPPAFIANLDESLRDTAIRAATHDTAETRLTVVDIDDDSLASVERWPWRRTTLATLVETVLSDYGAAAVALDMVLPEAGDPAGDDRLNALANSGPLVLAAALDFVARDRPLHIGTLSGGLPPSALHDRLTPHPATGWIANHGGLRTANCVGSIGFAPDPDGIVRRLPLFAQAEGNAYPSLSLALLSDCTDQGALAGAAKLTDMRGDWRLPYRYGLSSYTVVPARAVLEHGAPRTLLEGRRVLIGASALGLTDRVATPLHPSTTGVMVHAVALSALLDAQETPPLPAWLHPLPVAWLLATLAGLTLLAALSGAKRTFTGIVACGLLWLAVVWGCIRIGIPVSPLAGFAAYVCLAGLVLPYEWSRQQKEARRLRRTFEHYVAKSVLDELLRHPDMDSLTPAYRDVTVLVADMEGYSGHTERLSLEAAGELTRDFLSCLTEPIIRLEGTLDKYTGDGLVAFWGAPINDPQHADHALDAARAILERMAEFNRQRAEKGEMPIRARIGIESGRALVGDLGTPFRSTYTAVGDCINIASRLQEMGRNYPWDVLIGDATVALTTHHALRPVATLPIRGLKQTVGVYRFATREEAS